MGCHAMLNKKFKICFNMMYFLFLIVFLPTNSFACHRVMCAQLELEKPKIIPPFIRHLDRLVPKTKAERISFFQRIDHLIHANEPRSLKCQAMRAFLKGHKAEEIINKPIPDELKEQFIEQEQLMDEYYRDILFCLKKGFGGKFRAGPNDCVFDILNSFADEEKTSTYFLETVRCIEKLNKEFFSRGLTSYDGYVNNTVGELLLAKTVKRGNYNFVRWLLKFAINPNYRDGRNSLLKFAIERDHPEVVEILLSNGVPVDTMLEGSYRLMSPLRFACTESKPKAATVLIKFGAQVNELDDQNRSILMEVARIKGTKCLRLLIANGAIVGLKDKETVLLYFMRWILGVGVQKVRFFY